MTTSIRKSEDLRQAQTSAQASESSANETGPSTPSSDNRQDPTGIRRILVPVDDSTEAGRAGEWAQTFASAIHSPDQPVEVHRLRVEPRESTLADTVHITEEDLLADLHIYVEPEETAEPSSAADEASVIERTIAHRNVATGILGYAQEAGIGMIVMPAHRREGVRSSRLGQTAETVVRSASCPVLTLHADDDVPSGGRVLIPVDLSSATDEVLRTALSFASDLSSDAVLLHVIERVTLPPAYGMVAPMLDTDDAKASARSELERRVGRLTQDLASMQPERYTPDVEIRVRTGHPATSILDVAAADPKPSAIALGTHGFRGLARMLLGSVAEQVIRHAPCPVLTVRTRRGSQ